MLVKMEARLFNGNHIIVEFDEDDVKNFLRKITEYNKALLRDILEEPKSNDSQLINEHKLLTKDRNCSINTSCNAIKLVL